MHNLIEIVFPPLLRRDGHGKIGWKDGGGKFAIDVTRRRERREGRKRRRESGVAAAKPLKP